MTTRQWGVIDLIYDGIAWGHLHGGAIKSFDIPIDESFHDVGDHVHWTQNANVCGASEYVVVGGIDFTSHYYIDITEIGVEVLHCETIHNRTQTPAYLRTIN